jgi:hypothetical protein
VWHVNFVLEHWSRIQKRGSSRNRASAARAGGLRLLEDRVVEFAVVASDPPLGPRNSGQDDKSMLVGRSREVVNRAPIA